MSLDLLSLCIGTTVGASIGYALSGARRRAASVLLDPLVDELHQLEATMTEDQIRASAMLLIGQGWPMSPPPPTWAWKRAYLTVLTGAEAGRAKQ